MKPEHATAFLVEKSADGVQHLFVVCDGMKIAERGAPDTPQAKQWIPLVAGYTIRDVGSDGLSVTFEGMTLQ